jgi:flagellar biosynthesis/type III secretory pathway protein FliH
MMISMMAALGLLAGYVWGKWSTKQFHDELAASEAGYEAGYAQGRQEGYQQALVDTFATRRNQ